MAAVLLDGYAPFDAGAGATVQEEQWRSMMRLTTDAGRVGGNGIIRNSSNQFRVYGDSSGSQVKVQTGECWIEGHWGITFAEKTVAIANGHATLARVDTVVLRMSPADNSIVIDVLQGTPSGSPSPPEPTIDNTMYEVRLAHVSVPALDTVIAANQVFDCRQYMDAPHITVRATADTVVNNTTTLTTATGMTMVLSTSAFYMFDGFIEHTSATTPDFKFSIQVPTGCAGRIGIIGIDVSASSNLASANFDTEPAVGNTFAVGGIGTADGNRLGTHIHGWLNTTHTSTLSDPLTNPFQMSFQFAQNTANASNTTLYSGSWLRLTRMI